jgi:hypothetical protein
MTERDASLLLSAELGYDHYNTLLLADGKDNHSTFINIK